MKNEVKEKDDVKQKLLEKKEWYKSKRSQVLILIFSIIFISSIFFVVLLIFFWSIFSSTCPESDDEIAEEIMDMQKYYMNDYITDFEEVSRRNLQKTNEDEDLIENMIEILNSDLISEIVRSHSKIIPDDITVSSDKPNYKPPSKERCLEMIEYLIRGLMSILIGFEKTKMSFHIGWNRVFIVVWDEKIVEEGHKPKLLKPEINVFQVVVSKRAKHRNYLKEILLEVLTKSFNDLGFVVEVDTKTLPRKDKRKEKEFEYLTIEKVLIIDV